MTVDAREAAVPLAVAATRLPRGELHYQVYPHALLRGSGMDARPLAWLGVPTPCRDAPDADEEAVRAEYGRALDTALTGVRKTLAVPRLRAAVGISNPSYHDIAFAPGRPLLTSVPYLELNKRGRQQVRTAHRYVRRLLAKTETNSYFGPTLAMTWDAGLDAAVWIGGARDERSVLGLSHWVTVELARRYRRDVPSVDRGWRRDSVWRRDGRRLTSALTGRQLALTAISALVWDRLALPASPAELSAAAGLTDAEVVAALALLIPALRPWPEPPAAVVDGLDWLERHYPGRPLVTQLTQLCGQADAGKDPIEVRAEIRSALSGAGLATSRSSGAHYADRDVVTEDRSSPWSDRVRLGGPAVASVYRALEHVLPVMFLGAMLRQGDAREAVRRTTGSRAVGLVELASHTIAAVTWRTDELAASLDALVPKDADLTEVRLDPGEVAAAVTPLWRHVAPLADDVLACLPGFDLMLTGDRPGLGRWVLSECHDDSSSALGGITSRVQPAGRYDEFCGTVARWLDAGQMANVVGRRRSRHITPELPGMSIELSGISAGPREHAVAAAEVSVSADASHVVYQGRRYQLYPGDVPGPLCRAISLPSMLPVAVAAGRPVTPRIVLGDLVIQRRSWQVPLPELGRHVAAWRAARAWQRQWDMPDQVFLRHPDEPKPLLIDFTDALAVADLCRLRPGAVSCSEVLPTLRDSWWRKPEPQPAELRIPVFLRWEPGERRHEPDNCHGRRASTAGTAPGAKPAGTRRTAADTAGATVVFAESASRVAGTYASGRALQLAESSWRGVCAESHDRAGDLEHVFADGDVMLRANTFSAPAASAMRDVLDEPLPACSQATAEFLQELSSPDVELTWSRYLQRVAVGDGEHVIHDVRSLCAVEARLAAEAGPAHAVIIPWSTADPCRSGQRLLDAIESMRRQSGLPMADLPPDPCAVVLDAGHGGAFFHELIGHPLEADAVVGQSSYLSRLRGEQVAPTWFEVTDGAGSAEGGIEVQVDDEGTRVQLTRLVHGGRVVAAMSDLGTAAALRSPSSGNGRRLDYRHCVLPRMWHTVAAVAGAGIEPGFRDGTRLRPRGLRLRWMNLLTGDFEFAVSGALLDSVGAPTRRVGPFLLAGNGLKVLGALGAGGTELGTCGARAIKGCGKLDQFPLPVSFANSCLWFSGEAVHVSAQ